MALDFQVVYPQESIVLTALRSTTFDGRPAIRATGVDFSAVDEVVINGVPSPAVSITSKTELVAQLPEHMDSTGDVHTVTVLNNRFTFSTRSLFRFRIGRRPGTAKGILRLLQLFVKLLLQTPGSDIFRPGSGGGLMGVVGSTFSAQEINDVTASMVIAVTRTQRQIVAMQSKDQRSPRDERLLSATVLGSHFDRNQGALYVTIEVISQAGKSAIANIEV